MIKSRPLITGASSGRCTQSSSNAALERAWTSARCGWKMSNGKGGHRGMHSQYFYTFLANHEKPVLFPYEVIWMLPVFWGKWTCTHFSDVTYLAMSKKLSNKASHFPTASEAFQVVGAPSCQSGFQCKDLGLCGTAGKDRTNPGKFTWTSRFWVNCCQRLGNMSKSSSNILA